MLPLDLHHDGEPSLTLWGSFPTCQPSPNGRLKTCPTSSPPRPIDLVENAALGEELLLRLFPRSGHRGDGEKPDVREVGGVLLQHRRVRRPIVVAGQHLLRLLGVQELE